MAYMAGVMRLGRDVEVKHTANGDPVAKLALAYNYGRKGEDGKRPAQWVDASLWGKRAEAMAPYLLKGTAVHVLLRDPYVREYKGKDGETRTSLNADVLEIEFAGGGGGGAQQERPAPAKKPADVGDKAGWDMDSDIPF